MDRQFETEDGVKHVSIRSCCRVVVLFVDGVKRLRLQQRVNTLNVSYFI